MICAVDESETITIFEIGKKKTTKQDIKQAAGIPSNLKGKDLFGMGYPYYVVANKKWVAVSTDFGICVMSL